jgi:flagellar hook-associated protein 2
LSSKVNFLGLNSNFDSASLVNQLIDLETQTKINPLQTKKTSLQRERSSLDTVATNVRDIKTALSYNSIKDGSKALAPKKVSTNDSTKEFISVTATDSAVAQSFQVYVDKLATNTIRKSSQVIKNDLTNVSPTASANFKGGVTLSDGTVTINGETKTFASTADDIAEIETFLNSFTGVTGTFNTTSGKFDLTGITSLGSAGDTSNMISALGLNNAQITAGNVTGIQNLEAVKANAVLTSIGITGTKITINGADINYAPATDTIQSLVTKINNSSGAKVSASYDAINGELIMTNKSTGALSITVSSNGNINPLNLNNVGSETLGNNAEFRISTLNGGATLVSNNNSISDIINGVTINLTKTNSNPITVNISEDSSGYRTSIDEIIRNINKLNTFLKNIDTTFSRNFSSRMRNIVSSVAGTNGVDTYTSLIDIGLKSNLDADGKFTGYSLDSTLFNKAFASAPDELNKILWGNSSDPKSIFSSLSNGNKGILVQLQELMDSYIDPSVPANGLINQIQETLSSQIKSVDSRIEKTQDSIDNLEQRMRRQFSQLDLITSQYQQQQSALNGLMAQLG